MMGSERIRRARIRRATGVVVVAAVGLSLVACGGKDEPKTVASVTTTSSTTSTTAAPTAPLAPLTGLPVDDPAKATRPALVVKIDNANEARPQSGINEADVVFEEQVEGGITRLGAIFQSNDSSPVGPIRSARTTDIAIASMLNKPLFAYSGANTAFQKMVRSAPLVDVGVDNKPSDYRRDKSRKAPHNLFSDTAALFKYAKSDAVAPPALFQFRTKDQPVSGAGLVPTTHAQIVFNPSLAFVTWDYDPATQTYKRGQSHTADVDLAGKQVAAKNVLIQFTEYHNVPGFKDPSGAPVPEANLVSTGEAWLLTGGQLLKGTWSKASDTAVTNFVDSAGAPFQLTPGQTWVELAPKGTATTS
jgi:hypothetical protein